MTTPNNKTHVLIPLILIAVAALTIWSYFEFNQRRSVANRTVEIYHKLIKVERELNIYRPSQQNIYADSPIDDLPRIIEKQAIPLKVYASIKGSRPITSHPTDRTEIIYQAGQHFVIADTSLETIIRLLHAITAQHETLRISALKLKAVSKHKPESAPDTNKPAPDSKPELWNATVDLTYLLKNE